MRTIVNYLILAAAAGHFVTAQAWQEQSGTPQRITVKGQAVDLYVSGVRPLADALYLLSTNFHWKIGFEEVKLQYSGDMVDVTSPSYTPKSKDDRAFDPRGGILKAHFDLTPTDDSKSRNDAVQALLTGYAKLGLPGAYSVEMEPKTGFLFMFPTSVGKLGG